jgi:two-component system, OmpR family, sensor histidine kinase QseC
MGMSLKWRLMLLFVGATLVVWLSVNFYLYRSALGEIDALYDTHLAQSAQILMALAETSAEHGHLEQLAELLPKLVPATLPWNHAITAHPGTAESAYQRMLAFQVLTRGGSFLLTSANAPDVPLAQGIAGFSDSLIDATRWRVYGVASQKWALVLYAGEDHALREGLARHLVTHLLVPTLVAIPPLLLLFWLAVGKGLSPLARLASEIKSRDQTDLAPLRTTSVPSEVTPLVDALDSLLQRLDRALASERHFTGNAAHELRTPVAALRIQAQVAQRATDDAQRRRALDQIVSGTSYATHLVEQLLTLSRLDAESPPLTLGQWDLLEAARRTAAALEPLAQEHAVRLRVSGEHGALTHGNETCILILLRNLIDNAIRHSPAGGQVRVAVHKGDQFNRVIVEDTGPGIADGQHAAMFQRFRRGAATTVSGSGLGLSIVRRICEIHSGRVHLENRKEGGLRCEVRLPPLAAPAVAAPQAETDL